MPTLQPIRFKTAEALKQFYITHKTLFETNSIDSPFFQETLTKEGQQAFLLTTDGQTYLQEDVLAFIINSSEHEIKKYSITFQSNSNRLTTITLMNLKIFPENIRFIKQDVDLQTILEIDHPALLYTSPPQNDKIKSRLLDNKVNQFITKLYFRAQQFKERCDKTNMYSNHEFISITMGGNSDEPNLGESNFCAHLISDAADDAFQLYLSQIALLKRISDFSYIYDLTTIKFAYLHSLTTPLQPLISTRDQFNKLQTRINAIKTTNPSMTSEDIVKQLKNQYKSEESETRSSENRRAVTTVIRYFLLFLSGAALSAGLLFISTSLMATASVIALAVFSLVAAFVATSSAPTDPHTLESLKSEQNILSLNFYSLYEIACKAKLFNEAVDRLEARIAQFHAYHPATSAMNNTKMHLSLCAHELGTTNTHESHTIATLPLNQSFPSARQGIENNKGLNNSNVRTHRH